MTLSYVEFVTDSYMELLTHLGVELATRSNVPNPLSVYG